jgi:flagellar hook-associated protein 2
VISLASYAVKTGDKLYTAADSVDRPASITSSQPVNSPGNTVIPYQTLSSQSGSFLYTPESSGVIVINGKEISWDANSSVNDIMASINSSSAGVTVNFDDTLQTFTISSVAKGSSAKFTISETSGNLLEVFGITAGTYSGSNAQKTNISATLSSGVSIDIPVTSGVFTINGVKFSVNTDTDSINNILSRINYSGAGVIATYDSLSGAISIVSKESGITGEIRLGSADDTSNFLYAMKLSSNNPPTGGASDTYTGTRAQISINGGETVYRDSNSVDGLIPGITIKLNNVGNSMISVKSDKTAIINAVSDFVTMFNSVMGNIEKKMDEKIVNDPKTAEQKFTGALRGNSSLRELRDRLVELVSNSYQGLSSGLVMLDQVGLKLSYTDNYSKVRLELNKNTFESALNSNFDGVKELFSSATGFAQNAYSGISGFTSYNGIIRTEIRGVDTIIEESNVRISEFEQRLADEEKMLKKQFTEMETALSKMKNQLLWLLNITGNYNS